jgi:hypothetical protein
VQSASSGEESEEAVVYPLHFEPVPIHRYRVMYTDGHVEDFLAARDDSNLRQYMLQTHWGPKGPPSDTHRHDGIAGVVDKGVDHVYTPTPGGAATDTPKRRMTRQRPSPE